MKHEEKKLEIFGRRIRGFFSWVWLKKIVVIAIVLGLTNAATLGLLIYQNRPDAIKKYKNPYPFIDPARNLIDQKYFFSTIEPVRKQMKEIAARYEKEGNQVGVYFEFLNTGANVSINQDTRFWPASLSKIPTALVVMKKIEKGDWKLTNEMVLMADDKDEKFGDLYKKPTGTKFTIEELLKETLIHSDNSSHRILVRNLSSEDYTDMFEALGLENFFDKEYNITAKEYSRIFRVLFNSSYVTRENSEKLLQWLSATPYNELLGSGVPDEVKFSHKIGEAFEEGVFLDSGIVYVSDRPYLITVMIKTVGDSDDSKFDKAKLIMKELSQAAYDYVANN